MTPLQRYQQRCERRDKTRRAKKYIRPLQQHLVALGTGDFRMTKKDDERLAALPDCQIAVQKRVKKQCGAGMIPPLWSCLTAWRRKAKDIT